MDENLDLGISFDLPKNQSNVIKAIGVGGGGSNAINHMYRQALIHLAYTHSTRIATP